MMKIVIKNIIKENKTYSVIKLTDKSRGNYIFNLSEPILLRNLRTGDMEPVQNFTYNKSNGRGAIYRGGKSPSVSEYIYDARDVVGQMNDLGFTEQVSEGLIKEAYSFEEYFRQKYEEYIVHKLEGIFAFGYVIENTYMSVDEQVRSKIANEYNRCLSDKSKVEEIEGKLKVLYEQAVEDNEFKFAMAKSSFLLLKQELDNIFQNLKTIVQSFNKRGLINPSIDGNADILRRYILPQKGSI